MRVIKEETEYQRRDREMKKAMHDKHLSEPGFKKILFTNEAMALVDRVKGIKYKDHIIEADPYGAYPHEDRTEYIVSGDRGDCYYFVDADTGAAEVLAMYQLRYGHIFDRYPRTNLDRFEINRLASEIVEANGGYIDY